MPLPKGHPQREANRVDNEQQRKQKEDEAEKEKKHKLREARWDVGEDTDTTEEDNDENVKEFNNVSSVSFESRGGALCL